VDASVSAIVDWGADYVRFYNRVRDASVSGKELLINSLEDDEADGASVAIRRIALERQLKLRRNSPVVRALAKFKISKNWRQ
jgi:hypothetical protein